VTAPQETLTGGRLNQAVANAVVHAYREHLGRGPTSAQAFYRHNVVVVMLRDAMTTAERSLVAGGREDAVLNLRREVQHIMGRALDQAIERLTGRRVEARLSASRTHPDVGVEVFVLDQPLGETDAGFS
jgi:uncharacterized protein YbcI